MSDSLEAVAELPGAEQNLTDLVEAHEVNEQVRRAITTLHERERLVVLLFYGTGYALKEIAAFLDVPITTVKKRLYDARQHLKDELIDLMRDVLQEQRPSIAQTLPAKVRLLIADRQTLARGERIDLFFGQPFVVAEAFTDIPGTHLTCEETIASFRDLLDGRYDDMPVQTFRFVGKIEQK